MKTLELQRTLDYIKRDGDEYSARYTITEMVTKNVALPVFTGNVSMSGVVTKSHTLKAINTDYQIRTRDDVMMLTEAEARELVSKINYRRQNTASGWVLWAVR